MRRKTLDQEWVALQSGYDESPGWLYEAGAIYTARPPVDARPLTAEDAVITCPACGRRFTRVDDSTTAESLRDIHINGDEDIATICGTDMTPQC